MSADQVITGQVITAYGPIAFGVASLMLIWARIVAPEMRANREAVTAVERTVNSAKLAAENAKQAASLALEAVRLMRSRARTNRRNRR